MGLVCVCVLSLTDSLASPPAVSRFNGLTVRNCDENLNDTPAVKIHYGWVQSGENLDLRGLLPQKKPCRH